MDEELALKFAPLFRLLRAYHRHEVHGIENIPSEGGVLVACNHSLATYDISLLMAAVYDSRQRMPRSLIDRAFFRVPGLGEFMERVGGVMGTPDNAQALLAQGQMVMVAPGGMRESLRPSAERYQILWEKRLGFAKMAMMAGSPIVLAACPKADDLFDVFSSSLTRRVYNKFKMPLPIALGLGPTFIPKPIKLRHFLSEPLYPPPVKGDEKADEKALVIYHKKLVKRMRELIWEGINYRESP